LGIERLDRTRDVIRVYIPRRRLGVLRFL
jgi:hypothetical protein